MTSPPSPPPKRRRRPPPSTTKTGKIELPKPHAGLVIRYAYLWHSEYLQGQEEGVKDRPCAMILVTETKNGEQMVTVLPITHRPPTNSAHAIGVPAATCNRLGLDDRPQWVVLTEANRFLWPGPDLRFGVGGDLARAHFGDLPRSFYAKVRDAFLAHARKRKPPMPWRDE